MSNTVLARTLGTRPAIECLAGTATVVNCTVATNASWGLTSSGGVATVRNSIFWGNTSGGVKTSGLVTVTWTCSQEALAGEGNISADPRFANAAGSDFHLKSRAGRWCNGGWTNDTVSSPCIDAGDASPYAREPEPNGGRINLGAYGNTAQASKSGLWVETLAATGQATNSVTLRGYVQPVSGTATACFYVGPSNGGTNRSAWSNEWCVGERGRGEFATNLTDVPAATTFYFRAYACTTSTPAEEAWADETRSFRLGIPAIDNDGGASNVTFHTADLNGCLLDAGMPGTQVTVWYGYADGGTEKTNWSFSLPLGTPAAGFVTQTAYSLADNTTYYYRYYASNAAGTCWSPTPSVFTTPLDYTGGRYVTPDGTGNGESWDNASSNLQAMVNFMAPYAGGVVYIKEGSYLLTTQLVVGAAAGLSIKGGYSGTGAPGPTNQPSVLSGWSNRVIFATNSTLWLEGLTLSGGKNVPSGGGVSSVGGSLTMVSCHVVSNSTTVGGGSSPWGGGVYKYGGSLCLSGCRVEGNELKSVNYPADALRGAGVAAVDATVDISNCTVVGNWASGVVSGGAPARSQGAGLHVRNGQAAISDSLFVSNYLNVAQSSGITGSEMAYGGGLYAESVVPLTVVRCAFASNYTLHPMAGISAARGGSVYMEACQAAFSGCTMLRNAVQNLGGGSTVSNKAGDVFVNSGSASFWNTVIAGNAGGRGGVEVQGGSAQLVNSTLAANSNGAVRVAGGSAQVRNSIVWANRGVGLTNLAGTALDASYSCLQEWRSGEGNFVADPLFGDAAKYDYHLKSRAGRWCNGTWTNDTVTSPCVDAGDDSPYGQEPWPNGERVNLGAYGNTPQASKSPLAVATRPATGVEGDHATLNGELLADDGLSTDATFYWGPSNGQTDKSAWSNEVLVGAIWAGWFSTNLTGLAAGTTYYYRCYASNSLGDAWASTGQQFRAGVAEVDNDGGATSVQTHSATLNGNLTLLGSGLPEVRVYYGQTDGATTAGSWQTNYSFGTQNVGFLSVAVTGLVDGAQHYYRFCASDSFGDSWAPNSAQFVTQPDTSIREFYVRPGGAGAQTGRNWENALSDLQTTVSFLATDYGDVVYLMSGVYSNAAELVVSNAPWLILSGGYDGVGSPGPRSGTPTVLTRAVTGRVMRAVSSALDLEWITISGGRLASGAGVEAAGAGLLARDCGRLQLMGCTISDNACVSSDNSVNPRGAGLYIENCYAPTLRGCTIRGNALTTWMSNGRSYGAGLCITGGFATVQNCVIEGNRGVAVPMYPDSGQTASYGGGMAVLGTTLATVRNCLIAGNHADASGGGVYAAGGATVDFSYCTVADNLGSEALGLSGSAMSAQESVLRNYGNTAWSASLSLNRCSVDGPIAPANGSFTNAPLFERGYYLATNSPCVDAGSTNASDSEVAGLTTRVDGAPDTGTVDLGFHCDRGAPAVTDLYVNCATGSDTNSGLSWGTAKKTVTAALAAAVEDATRVHLATGRYDAAGGEVFPLWMRSGVELVGEGTGPDETVIDAGAAERVMVVSSCLTGTRLVGLRLQNGRLTTPASGTFAARGGGVYVEGSWLTVSNCTVAGSVVTTPQGGGSPGQASGGGGGLFALASAVDVVDSRFEDNEVVWKTGGGSGPRVLGGAIYADSGRMTVRGTRFRSNSVRNFYGGGGPFVGGGAIYARLGPLSVSDCRFLGNGTYAVSGSGWARGGACLALNVKGLQVDNSLFAANYAPTRGAALAAMCSGLLRQCTFADNTGAAAVSSESGGMVVTNCILWRNSADLYASYTNALRVANSCVERGASSYPGGANLSVNPLFERGYYLAPTSRCVNAGGTPASALGLGSLTTQAGGAPDTGPADLGYHYRAGAPAFRDIYVDPVGGGDEKSGDSPAEAYKTLSKALGVAAEASARIHAATGRYDLANGEKFPLQLVSGVELLGAGSGADGSVVDAGGTSRVFEAAACLAGSRLSGLRIRNGRSTAGGGLRTRSSILTVEACVFETNVCASTASQEAYGGGLCAEGGSLLIDACRFASNVLLCGGAWVYGGGLYASGGDVLVRNCDFVGNEAARSSGSGSGGGVYSMLAQSWGGVSAGRFVMDGCRVVGNRSAGNGYGGGLYLNPLAVVSNSVIVGNSGYMGGGAWDGQFFNCLIATNAASNGGGGMYNGFCRGSLICSNTTWSSGGGTCNTKLENCTVVDNRANSSGGGTSGGTIWNSIVCDNRGAGSASNYSGGTFTYSFSDPPPAGTGNVTGAVSPGFIAPASRDYRLQPSSPCVDRGINQPWMAAARDLEDNPRVLSGRVDMGAYEAPMVATLRVLLEGPYNADSNAMSRALSETGKAPLTSPYASDRRTAPRIPSNVTDWVLVQVLDTNGTVVVTRSAFVEGDGDVVSPSGLQGIEVEVAAMGSYYFVVKQRNHLAVMSAAPVAFTNRVIAYDFTTGSDKYWGGTNAAVELEPGVWGMRTGDTDGDGEILPVDADMAQTQVGQTGYRRADFDMDGDVDAADLAKMWPTNGGWASAVSNAQVYLSPALSLAPVRLTLLTGETNAFAAAGATGTVHWAFVRNRSEGSVAEAGTNALYTAGASNGVVDVIETWDEAGRIGRAYANVISPEDIARAGKAVIVAGRKGADDPLWPTTDHLCDAAYNALRYRGFSKQYLAYLSPEPGQDVDGDGEPENVQESTLANASNTFTNWAMDAERLFVYLCDHGGYTGGEGYFRLNSTQTLSATSLDAWLDLYQDATTNDVIVVLDFCYAGSFLKDMAYAGPASRIVIAACGTNEPTYFVAGGLVSFSDAFFSGVLLGLNVRECFAMAREAMSAYQGSMLDDDGDGDSDGEDGAQAEGAVIGATFVAGKDMPLIVSAMGDQQLAGGTEALLWAGGVLTAYPPIARVWCVVVPPGHNPDPDVPVADLVERDLAYNPATGHYEAWYDGFVEEGTYKVMFYAKDAWDSVSLPVQRFVKQVGYDERAVVVAGGVTNWAKWSAANAMANLAYHTFRGRWLGADQIHYESAESPQDLDGDGTNDVDATPPRLADLGDAVTNWAMGAQKLTVYLTGEGTNGALRLNSGEDLAATDLSGWLDAFQQSNAEVTVIMDFAGAGDFLPTLAPPPGVRRIVIASTAGGQPAAMGNEGRGSFTRYLMGSLFAGDDLGEAFRRARVGVRRSSGLLRQRAMLDDDGDGASTKLDRQFAATRHVGTAFRTGAEAPMIDAITPSGVLTGGTAVALWAAGVTDMDGISNVWCAITAPDHDGQASVPETNLAWSAENQRYEAVYTNAALPGTYVFTFYAKDNSGDVSAPVQAEILRPDAYEQDDDGDSAAGFVDGTTQAHNMHRSGDEDWVRFFAVTDWVYEIGTEHWGTNVDTAIEVYRQMPDGTLSNVGVRVDEGWVGEDEGEITWLDYPQAGLYYVRVVSGDTNAWGPDSEYDLTIWVPAGADGSLWVAALDVVDGARPPPGACAVVDGTQTQYFNGVSTVIFQGLNASVPHNVTVPVPAGYWPSEDPKISGAVSNANEANVYGNPKLKTVIASKPTGAAFSFWPMARVQAIVRDAQTGARVNAARVGVKAKSGSVVGLVYTSFQNTAWAGWWATDGDGSLPNDGGGEGLMAPAVACDLVVSNAGYVTLTVNNVFAAAPAGGSVSNVGTVWLQPLDGNANGVADSWEQKHFPGGMGSKTNDPDHDGLDNDGEYGAGTDPTNAASVLGFDGTVSNLTGGFLVQWDSVPWRTYRVRGTNTLMGGSVWPVLSPDMEATQAQYRMSWLDASATGKVQRFYRVDVVLP